MTRYHVPEYAIDRNSWTTPRLVVFWTPTWWLPWRHAAG